MLDRTLYLIQVRWYGEAPSTHVVSMTKREATLLERGLKGAYSDKRIDEYSIQNVESVAEGFPEMLDFLRETVVGDYLGPREWIPEKEEKPWPFIEISDRRLICSHCPGDERLEFPATKSGAKSLGEELAARKIKKWLYSSSVDFPTEYGARNLDFRSIIETAAGMDISEDRPW